VPQPQAVDAAGIGDEVEETLEERRVVELELAVVAPQGDVVVSARVTVSERSTHRLKNTRCLTDCQA